MTKKEKKLTAFSEACKKSSFRLMTGALLVGLLGLIPNIVLDVKERREIRKELSNKQ